jgi:carbamoyl-phosphate synthase small subunit
VLAQPEVGATGVGADDLDQLGLERFFESPEARISGLVVSACTDSPSHRGAVKSLPKWLKKQQVAGIEGIDTRALVQRIAVRGTMRAKILVSDAKDVSFSSATLHSQPANVSVRKTITYGTGAKKIVAVDCGIKNSAIRNLAAADTTVIRVPCSYDFTKDDFDAVYVGGAPGDPTSCEKTIEILREALKLKKANVRQGQGAVILAIAGGASAFRMAQGHHGASEPCVDLDGGRCWITAQNHGYGIRDASLPRAGCQPISTIPTIRSRVFPHGRVL